MVLIPLYGDQLSLSLPSLENCLKNDAVILLPEVKDEGTYVKHHKKKLVFQISALRHFVQELRDQGYKVHHVALDDPKNLGTFAGEVKRAASLYGVDRVIFTHPGEYRQLMDIHDVQKELEIPVEIQEDPRFFISSSDFSQWASGRKSLRMENFYHMMRRKTGLLIDHGQPLGGRWNYDSQNRLPLNRDISDVGPLRFHPDTITYEVMHLVDQHYFEHIGNVQHMYFAVTREDALKALDHFLHKQLPLFGDFQDAMHTDQPFLYHSILSPYINIGLLSPFEVCSKVEKAYYSGHAPINAVEGFIRQVLGWREFTRGIYWRLMPEYLDLNFFKAYRGLPGFYWSGKTSMNCLHQVIKMTKDEAYSHHIQRLMVTGNFALLAGLSPQQVHEWYLGVYADAYEWVEAPNTLGMALYADGGIVGTKPYVASGAYINRMSNFCHTCPYKVGKKTGEDACPFNVLYWNFLLKHEKKLKKIPRMNLALSHLKRIDSQQRQEIREQAETFLDHLM